MRVGVCGVSSTGKSTLSGNVARALGLPHLLDKDLHAATFARMEEDGVAPHTRFFPDMTKEEHVMFERYILNQRISLEYANENFVADETPFDFLNYLYNVAAPYPDLMPSKEFSAWKHNLEGLLARYDLIVYLPFGQLPIENDGRRFTNLNLLQGWDYSLQGIIKTNRHHLQTGALMKIGSADQGERLKSVLDYCLPA